MGIQAFAICIPKPQVDCPEAIQNCFLCVFPRAHSQGYTVLWEHKEANLVRAFCLMSQLQGHVAREKSSHSHVAAERRHRCMVLASDVGWTSSHSSLARLLIYRGIFHFVSEKAGLGI